MCLAYCCRRHVTAAHWLRQPLLPLLLRFHCNKAQFSAYVERHLNVLGAFLNFLHLYYFFSESEDESVCELLAFQMVGKSAGRTVTGLSRGQLYEHLHDRDADTELNLSIARVFDYTHQHIIST